MAKSDEIPGRSIPVATYVSVTVIVAFYMASVWIIHWCRTAEIQGDSVPRNPAMLLCLSNTYGGEALTAGHGLLLVAACWPAFCGPQCRQRYLFALASDHVTGAPSRSFIDYHSPHVASIVMTLLAACCAGSACIGVAPISALPPQPSGLAPLAFLHADRFACGYRLLHQGQAGKYPYDPCSARIGALGDDLLVLVANSYEKLTGSSNTVVNGLPWLFSHGSSALIYARYLKNNRPNIYAQLRGAITVRRFRSVVLSRPLTRTITASSVPAFGAHHGGAFVKEGVPSTASSVTAMSAAFGTQRIGDADYEAPISSPRNGRPFLRLPDAGSLS